MYGIGHTLGMAIKACTRKLFGITWHRMILFSKEIPDVSSERANLQCYDIRRLSIADFEAPLWKTSFLSERKRAIYELRFSSPDDECYGIFVEGILACIAWIHYGGLFIYNQFYVNTGEKSSYMYDAFCAPKFRRRGLQKIITAHRMNVASSKGIKKAFTAIATFNRPSLRTYKKNGYEEVIRFWIIEFRGHAYCSLKSLN